MWTADPVLCGLLKAKYCAWEHQQRTNLVISRCVMFVLAHWSLIMQLIANYFSKTKCPCCPLFLVLFFFFVRSFFLFTEWDEKPQWLWKLSVLTHTVIHLTHCVNVAAQRGLTRTLHKETERKVYWEPNCGLKLACFHYIHSTTCTYLKPTDHNNVVNARVIHYFIFFF